MCMGRVELVEMAGKNGLGQASSSALVGWNLGVYYSMLWVLRSTPDIINFQLREQEHSSALIATKTMNLTQFRKTNLS
jgi:hypothetical protein